MMITENNRVGLSRLLLLAREERMTLCEDLSDVAEARRAAELSLARLENLIDGESGGRNFARRRRLAAMLATLEQAEADARGKLEAAAGLATRLEALIAPGPAMPAPKGRDLRENRF